MVPITFKFNVENTLLLGNVSHCSLLHPGHILPGITPFHLCLFLFPLSVRIYQLLTGGINLSFKNHLFSFVDFFFVQGQETPKARVSFCFLFVFPCKTHRCEHALTADI